MSVFNNLLLKGKTEGDSWRYIADFGDSTPSTPYTQTAIYPRETNDRWQVEFNMIFNYTLTDYYHSVMGLISCVDSDDNGPYVLISIPKGYIVLNGQQYPFDFYPGEDYIYHLIFTFNSPSDCNLQVTGTQISSGDIVYELNVNEPCSSTNHGEELLLRYKFGSYSGDVISVFRGGCYVTEAVVRYNYVPEPVFSNIYSYQIYKINQAHTSYRGLWTSLQCYERNSRMPLVIETTDGSVPDAVMTEGNKLFFDKLTDNLWQLRWEIFDTNSSETETITVSHESGETHEVAASSGVQTLAQAWDYVGLRLSDIMAMPSEGGTLEYWVNLCRLDKPRPYSSDGVHFFYIGESGSLETVTPAFGNTDAIGRTINTDNAFTGTYMIDTSDPECVKITVSAPANDSGHDRYCLMIFEKAPMFIYQPSL